MTTLPDGTADTDRSDSQEPDANGSGEPGAHSGVSDSGVSDSGAPAEQDATGSGAMGSGTMGSGAIGSGSLDEGGGDGAPGLGSVDPEAAEPGSDSDSDSKSDITSDITSGAKPAKLSASLPGLAGLGLALTHNDRALSALKNKFKGRTVFVLGNGPSVKFADLERLAGAVCLATNRFYLAYEQTDLRPAYVVASGAAMLNLHGEDLLARANAPVLVPYGDAARVDDGATLDRAMLFHTRPDDGPVFQPNPFKGLGSGGGLTVFLAMQLAAWMGARRLVLYGVDLSYVVSDGAEQDGAMWRDDGEQHHFLAGYRSKGQLWREPDMGIVNGAMDAAARWAEAHGLTIVNATHGGALNAFDRVDLGEEIAGSPPAVTSYLPS